MLSTLAFMAAIVGQVVGPVGHGPSSTEPIVQVGLYGYRTDGSLSSAAYDTPPSLESTVYTSGSLCHVGTGSRGLPAMAAHAWRFTGKVLSSSPEEAVVQVDWQRVLDQGNAATTPGGSVQLTLRVGDRVMLDTALPQSTLSCSVASVAFEARYVSRQALWGSHTTVFSGRGVGVGGGTGGGGGAGRGSGGARAGSTSGVAVAGAGGGRGSAAGAGAGQEAGSGAGLLNVDLWLVHTAPGKTDEVLHQLLRSSPEGALFAFAPITIDTPRGAAVVQVTGSFAVTSGASGSRRLIFHTSRRVTFPQADQANRDSVPDTQGNSVTNNPFPAPDEVLSFEMPPLRANGRPPVPDQFSVRVRIR